MCQEMPRASALLHHMRGDYVEAVRSWLRLRDMGPALGYIGRYGRKGGEGDVGVWLAEVA